MTKKWLMYAVTGLLCCSLIGFAVAKQNATNSRTALERAKLELATPSVQTTGQAGASNMSQAQINSAMANVNRAENSQLSAKAPEGYSVATEAVSPYEAAKAAYERMLNNTMLPGDKALIETLPADVVARPVEDNLDDNGGTWFSWSGSLGIPDAGCPTRTTQTLVVSGLTNPVADVEVRLNVTHTWDGDGQYYLIGPNAVEIALVLNRGGSGDNFVNCVLDDEAATAISAGAAPFTGSFRPEVPLSTFDGINGNGTWTLSVCDWAGGDVPTLTGFEVQILEASAGPDLGVSLLAPCGNNPPNPTQTVSLRVTNGGGSASAATTARFDFDGGGTIGSFAVPALAPSSFFDVFFTTTINLTVGPHTLVGSVDAVAGETITGNNTTQCVPNGFVCFDASVTAPGSWTGTTVGAGDDCVLRVGNDYVYQITIPTTGNWSFSLCGSAAAWDSYIYLTDACCGGTIINQNDDGCAPLSIISCQNLAAGTYYLDIEPWSGASGAFTLDVTSCVLGACCYGSGSCGVMEEIDCVGLAGIYQGDNTTCEGVVCDNPCAMDCDPFDLTEASEANYCNDNGATDPNGGCNVSPPSYQDIACGDWVCGETFTCDATGFRDTDWYRFTLTSTMDVTITAQSESQNFLYGIVDITDCAGAFFITNAFITDCSLGPQSITAFCLPPGDYVMFGATGNFSGLPQGGSNNQYRMHLECAPCSQTIGKCCYNNFNSCEDLIETNCLNLGGFWDGTTTCAETPCVNPCVLTCGNNDLTEADETGYCDNNGATDPNGGCNVIPESYQDIACGDTVCGETFTCDATGYRDTDWFRFTVVQAALVSVSVQAESNSILYGIVDISNCASAFFITNSFITDCQLGWQTVSAGLNPGTYVAFVAPSVFSGMPFGAQYNSYRMALTGLCVPEPCDPVVDLAIYTQTAGNDPTATQLFWTAPQPEDYKVWSTTNPNNDGNPNDGADPDWTLEATLLGLAAGPQTWTAPAGFVAYKNYNVTAVCNVVQAPVGRCCYPDFLTCDDITEAACNEVGGTWTAFVSCATDPCPPPPPANDDCGSAIEVFNNTPLNGYNTGATGTDITACTFNDLYDVWYVYNAPNTNPITASLCDPTFVFDTGISAWTACGGTELACNDDFCTTNGLQSQITWTPSAAGPVYIRVTGYNAQTGTFVLTVTQ